MMQAESAPVQSAIAQWRQWQIDLPGKPEIVRTLWHGLSNQSFLLQAGETSMVLRINNTDEHLPGIDRQREASIWRAANAAGIAPPLLYASERYLVSSYVPGEQQQPNKAGDLTNKAEDLTDEVFRLIEKCHAIKIDTHQLDYVQHIQNYWTKIEQSSIGQSAIEQSGIGQSDIEQSSIEKSGIEQSGIEKPAKPIDPALLKQRQPMQESLQALLDQQQATVLCHHDPVKTNFVGTPKRLYLIDWEYAAKGMAVMDYAALAVEWGFSNSTICTRTSIRPDSLVMAKNLYRYMCQLWEAAQSDPK